MDTTNGPLLLPAADFAELPAPERIENIVKVAKGLIDGRHPGILTTVDGKGHPHARWMSTLALEDFPYMYTLTSATSRKLSHIAEQPRVAWMFSGPDLEVILNLSGQADIVSSVHDQKRIWDMIVDKSHAYFLKKFGASSEFVVLKTTVHQIECTVPEKNLHWQISVDSFMALA